MKATMTETWLDILPALPLARGVPVTGYTRHGHRFTGIVTFVDPRDARGAAIWTADAILDAEHNPRPHREQVHDGWLSAMQVATMLRVDLDDPQGFGYALRRLLRAVTNEDKARAETPEAWATAHRLTGDYAVLRGEVTERDKLALALALREVTA